MDQLGLSVFGRSFYTRGRGKDKYLERRHDRQGPRNYVRSDERIRDEVCEILYWDPEVDASEIDVTVKEGVIYLEGEVDSRHAKRRAEDILENIAGMNDIQNRLSLKPTLDMESDKTITRGDDGLYSEESLPR